MARQAKTYRNRKFTVSELSNFLKEIIRSFDTNQDAVSINYYFVTDDGIEDRKELTFEGLDVITALEDKTLQFAFQGSINGYIHLNGHNYDGLTGSELSISVELSTIKELKKVFSIVKTELNLEELSDEKNVSNEDSDSGVKKVKPTIKPIKKDYQKKFGPIRIFKEDLIHIIRLFKKSYEYSDIKLDEYNIVDESNIENVRSEINKDLTNLFSINGRDNKFGSSSLRLDLSGYSARITAYDSNDVKAVGILNQIDPILSKRENKILKFIDSKLGFIIIFIITFGILGIVVWNLVNGDKLQLNGLDNILPLVGFLPFIMILINFLLTNNKYSLIYLFKSNENKHFLMRNKDNLIIGIILLIIGSILSLITKAFGLS